MACLVHVAAGQGFFSQLQQHLLSKRQDYQDLCMSMNHDCGMNGYCVEENAMPVCYCYYPYYGDYCDQVCQLEECWETFWQDLESYWSTDACYTRRTLHNRGRTTNLKRSLELKKKIKLARRDREPSAVDPGYSDHCRASFGNLTLCLHNSLATNCADCTEDTIRWVLEVLDDHVNEQEMHCGEQWECMNPETTRCVDAVHEVMYIHYDSNEVEVDPAHLLEKLNYVGTCVEKVISEELSLAGCLHNNWIQQELMLFLVVIIKAEIQGCNLTLVDEQCSVMESIFEMDSVCSMTLSQRGNLLDQLEACGRTQAALQGPVCDGVVDSLTPAKPILLQESVKECATIDRVESMMSTCQATVTKRRDELSRMLGSLSDEKHRLLKRLLNKLIQNL